MTCAEPGGNNHSPWQVKKQFRSKLHVCGLRQTTNGGGGTLYSMHVCWCVCVCICSQPCVLKYKTRYNNSASTLCLHPYLSWLWPSPSCFTGTRVHKHRQTGRRNTMSCNVDVAKDVIKSVQLMLRNFTKRKATFPYD